MPNWKKVIVSGSSAHLNQITGSGGVKLPDTVRLNFGDANDLKIYHSGNHSIIQDTGTGDLRIKGSVIKIQGTSAAEDIATFTEDGSVDLYYDDSKKLETTSAGVTVTGTATAGGFTTTGTWTFDEYTSGTIGITTVQDSGTSFNDNDTSLMTAGAIDDRILDYGYSTTTGTVTSVGTTGTVNGLTLSGTVTTSGNLTLGGTLAINNSDWSGADLSVANGGTGASTFTDGGILFGNGTDAIQASAVLAAGEILIGDGTTEPTILDVGSASGIEILGTIGTGVWQGTEIGLGYGGTELVGETDGKIVVADGNGAPVHLDIGSSTAITILGTIATGTWNGTKVASAYLDDDTAHLSTTQTFSGAKTFSSTTTKLSNANAQLWVGEGDGASDIYFSKGDTGDEVRFSKNLAGSLDILTNAATHHMDVDGSQYLNGGNVGIGETSPDSLLHIKSSAPAFRLEGSPGSADGDVANLLFYHGTNNVAKIRVKRGADAADGEIEFFTANDSLNSAAMHIDQNSKVGIGTSAPTSILTVAGEPLGVGDLDALSEFI